MTSIKINSKLNKTYKFMKFMKRTFYNLTDYFIWYVKNSELIQDIIHNRIKPGPYIYNLYKIYDDYQQKIFLHTLKIYQVLTGIELKAINTLLTLLINIPSMSYDHIFNKLKKISCIDFFIYPLAPYIKYPCHLSRPILGKLNQLLHITEL